MNRSLLPFTPRNFASKYDSMTALIMGGVLPPPAGNLLGLRPFTPRWRNRIVDTLTGNEVIPGQLFSNTDQTYIARCPPGLSGSDVVVTIPAGTYTDVFSQAAANAQALSAATEQADSELVCARACFHTYTVPVSGVTICFGWEGLIPDPNGTWTFVGTEEDGYTLVQTPPVGLFFSFNCVVNDGGDPGQLFLQIDGPTFDGITPPTPGGVSGDTTVFRGTIDFTNVSPAIIPNNLVCSNDPSELLVGTGGSAAASGSNE